MANGFSRRLLTTQARVRSRSRSRPLETVMDMLVLGQVSPRVFRLSNVSVNPLMPHACLNLKERQAGERKGKSRRLLILGSAGQKSNFTLFLFQASGKKKKKSKVIVIFVGFVTTTELVYKFHVALHAFCAAIPKIDSKISAQIHLSHLYQNSTIMKPIEQRIQNLAHMVNFFPLQRSQTVKFP